jgi:UPF0755 protein
MPRAGIVYAALLALTAGCHVPPPAAPVWVNIPDSATVAAVADTLQAHGIVESARKFERYARRGNRHLGIKPGMYTFRPRTPVGKIMIALRKGGEPVRRFVVRERVTIAELARDFEALFGIQPEDIAAAAADPGLRERAGARAATIEGYLYPTAYWLYEDVTAIEALRQMADTFNARWRPEWDARLDSLGLSRDEIVTLASIIAGEMPYGDERFQVSSVYHNRLNRGMRLQADPTVVYALGQRRRLTFADYRIPSEYNTYTFHGLPPGPIGQPSAESIEAALYPAETPYLYFVGGWDGRHVFSRSYREHLASIRRVRSGNGRLVSGPRTTP